jgi:hypothetical protein
MTIPANSGALSAERRLVCSEWGYAMNEFKFQVLEMRDSSPEEWLSRWATRFDEDTGAILNTRA